MGIDTDGQLGLGLEENEIMDVPTLVEGLSNIKDIYTGLRSSFCVDANDTVFSFGKGTSGELGTRNTKNEYIPVAIKFPSNASILKISCGVAHTAFLDESGRVYCSGSNLEGQLGLASYLGVDQPTVNNYLPVAEIIDIACADSYSLFLSCMNYL